MKVNFFSKIFKILLIINFFNPNDCRLCGGFVPDNATECTTLSTKAYFCCYTEGSVIFTQGSPALFRLCYGIKAGTDPQNLPSIQNSPPIVITSFNCGLPVTNMIQKQNLCWDKDPNNSTDCTNRGSDCCLMRNDNVGLCVNSSNYDLANSGLDYTCSGNFLGGVINNKIHILLLLFSYVLFILH
jgi:hypothetical protein